MPDGICTIQSTLDDDGQPACLMRWGSTGGVIPVFVVLNTARELMAAASAAETDIALIETFRQDFNADDDTLGGVLGMVRGRRPMPEGRCALRIAAVAGAKTGKPYVHIGRGSMKGALSPDEARDMALHWTQAALAAQLDVKLRDALATWDRLDIVEIEDLFTLMREGTR
ncbi:hypothetical protein [Streptomyces sp. NPDC051452]|uniref:hypothetical protein n=1 Tax=Streptomyces sp. NPDC051452 TaxID=3365654 RepID=UPI0037AAD4BE